MSKLKNINLSNMKKTHLRDRARKEGLPVSGTKAELISMLSNELGIPAHTQDVSESSQTPLSIYNTADRQEIERPIRDEEPNEMENSSGQLIPNTEYQHITTLNLKKIEEEENSNETLLRLLEGHLNIKLYENEMIDQIEKAIELIKDNPDSRRIIVSAWNVGELEEMALMPCHAFFQFYVNDGKLSCQLYQRSADAFLGVPFNISSYSLLTCMIAHVCDLKPGEFIWTGGDCHLYLNHLEQAREQIGRVPKGLPTLWLEPSVKSIDDFVYNDDRKDIKIVEYNHHPHISAPISV